VNFSDDEDDGKISIFVDLKNEAATIIGDQRIKQGQSE
jgi:hypothetical protein